jgi:carboxyl-terminal processing protease
VPGGPAARSGKLAVGDRIVGVGQGDSPITDVVGSRVDEAVKLIRGTKDTKSSSTSCPPTPAPTASTSRSPSSATRSSSKSRPPQVGHQGRRGQRIGVITLPAFYEDFEGRRRGDKDFRSASRDVARLVDELKKEGSTA